jgi:hypothetical protein
VIIIASNIFSFPKQKLSYKSKDEEWAKVNVRCGILLSDYDQGKTRKSKDEMDLNYRLVSGDFDEKDVDRSLNPLNLKGVRWPVKIQNYPIELTKLDILKGEELSRPFNWFLRASNDHVVIQKEEREQEQLKNYVATQLDNPNFSETEVKKDLQKMKKYYNYDYQDEREEMGTRLLQHIWKTQRVPYITTDAFYDIVTVAEEIYACDIFHSEPTNRKVKPRNISVFGNGESNYIDNAMIIVEDSWLSVGSVIDMFFDELDDDQVTYLDEGKNANRMGQNLMLSGPVNMAEEYVLAYGTQHIPLTSKDKYIYGGGFDDHGNIRVYRVCWRSKVKTGYLTYYIDGEEVHDYVSEDYKINTSLGEKIEWQWLTEWWQGYCIGNVNDGIYVKMERLPRIGMTVNNPSNVMSPYVGTIYTIGDKAYSLIDRIRPYKYLYNITMTRAELASARNKGVLAEMDLARIPDGWEPDIWMMYAELNGWFVTNSFKEGNEGPAMGKLLSNLNNRAPATMNLDASQVIISNLELARWIKNEINEITGITPQREGQISNRETLGGVNRSLQQSSFITEPYFFIHDNTKLRLLELNLETAKYCYKNQNFAMNVMDDGLIGRVLKVDGKMLSETSFGMYLSDGRDDTELFQFIRQYAQAALQNDKANFKDIFEIMKSKSIAAVGKRMEEAEDTRQTEAESAAQKQYDAQQNTVESQIKWDQMKFNQETQIRMQELQNTITLKQMDLDALIYKTDAQTDIDKTKIEADIKAAKDKINLELEKLREQNDQFNRQLSLERDQFSKELQVKKSKKTVVA